MKHLSEQEKLTRWADKWVTSTNPVTASSWRFMYVRLYFEMYVI